MSDIKENTSMGKNLPLHEIIGDERSREILGVCRTPLLTSMPDTNFNSTSGIFTDNENFNWYTRNLMGAFHYYELVENIIRGTNRTDAPVHESIGRVLVDANNWLEDRVDGLLGPLYTASNVFKQRYDINDMRINHVSDHIHKFSDRNSDVLSVFFILMHPGLSEHLLSNIIVNAAYVAEATIDIENAESCPSSWSTVKHIPNVQYGHYFNIDLVSALDDLKLLLTVVFNTDPAVVEPMFLELWANIFNSNAEASGSDKQIEYVRRFISVVIDRIYSNKLRERLNKLTAFYEYYIGFMINSPTIAVISSAVQFEWLNKIYKSIKIIRKGLLYDAEDQLTFEVNEVKNVGIPGEPLYYTALAMLIDYFTRFNKSLTTNGEVVKFLKRNKDMSVADINILKKSVENDVLALNMRLIAENANSGLASVPIHRISVISNHLNSKIKHYYRHAGKVNIDVEKRKDSSAIFYRETNPSSLTDSNFS